MNQPWVYTSPPIPNPPSFPSPSYPSGLFQCPGFDCPVSCTELGLVIYFTYGNIHVSIASVDRICTGGSPSQVLRGSHSISLPRWQCTRSAELLSPLRSAHPACWLSCPSLVSSLLFSTAVCLEQIPLWLQTKRALLNFGRVSARSAFPTSCAESRECLPLGEPAVCFFTDLTLSLDLRNDCHKLWKHVFLFARHGRMRGVHRRQTKCSLQKYMLPCNHPKHVRSEEHTSELQSR